MKDRITITFQPTEEVLTLLGKAVLAEATPETPPRGLRSRVINRCIRHQLSRLNGTNGGPKKKSRKKAGHVS
jgi:hypothetical protein